VWTANTVYEMAVIDAARLKVLVHGGRHFAEASMARVAGARETTTERLGGIRVGLPLEFHVQGKVIVTSPVLRIEHRPVRGPGRRRHQPAHTEPG
jgi:hypothetical protein